MGQVPHSTSYCKTRPPRPSTDTASCKTPRWVKSPPSYTMLYCKTQRPSMLSHKMRWWAKSPIARHTTRHILLVPPLVGQVSPLYTMLYCKTHPPAFLHAILQDALPLVPPTYVHLTGMYCKMNRLLRCVRTARCTVQAPRRRTVPYCACITRDAATHQLATHAISRTIGPSPPRRTPPCHLARCPVHNLAYCKTRRPSSPSTIILHNSPVHYII